MYRGNAATPSYVFSIYESVDTNFTKPITAYEPESIYESAPAATYEASSATADCKSNPAPKPSSKKSTFALKRSPYATRTRTYAKETSLKFTPSEIT